jgi:MFS family permease
MALGVNQIAGISGTFVGLLLGGLLAAWDWRAVFWINVPIGVFGTILAYRSLHEISTSSGQKAKIDWPGNVTFALGAGLVLVAITYGIQPYGGSATGWGNPFVLGGLAVGVLLLVLFCWIENHVPDPMFRLQLFKIRAFAFGNIASLLGAIARGGLQFMLVIWLAGIWLPLHGYNYVDTPLWAGIYMLPLTAGFLIAGPISGWLSDKYGQRLFATTGLLVATCAFIGLMFLPIVFPYWAFGTLIFFNGVGSGLFASPNTSAIMSAVPANRRGSASGMRSTFQNAGMSLSIGIFFSLMVAGLASTLPKTLSSGLTAQGVPLDVASKVAHLPPVSTMFAALLGFNPVHNLLAPTGVLSKLTPQQVSTLTGKQFFPHVISAPFHHGLVIVFTAAAIMSFVGALVSLMRGKQFYYDESAPGKTPAKTPAASTGAAAATAPARTIETVDDDAAAHPSGSGRK